MSDLLFERDHIIYDEMMAHTPLFTHKRPENIAIIGDPDAGILTETLKHDTVTHAWHVSEKAESQPKVTAFTGEQSAWLAQIEPLSLDLIIATTEASSDSLKRYFSLLRPDGMLIQKSASPFQTHALKMLQQQLETTGFRDTQTVHFPQPSFPTGWRSSMMAKKEGTFKRVREKDIFNKTFTTRYYNFDVHRAALALPEFMREILVTA